MATKPGMAPKPIPKPRPDWGRRGTQPKGHLGPKPAPNGKIVATQPKQSQ